MTDLTFSQLVGEPALIEGLARININIPTAVQAQAIPLALDGKDIIVQSQTGSGKTLAFMLPILSKIISEKIPSDTTAAIIVTPTRELAIQVQTVVDSLGLEIVPACIIGGSSFNKQESQLRKDARVVVGTPGRLLDLISQRVIDLSKCETFVLDEADEMLSMGFLEDVRSILFKLPRKRQGMFFSATVSYRLSSLASGFLKNPETITVESNKSDQAKIEHFYVKVGVGVTTKTDAICNILKNSPGQSAIVFCNTKSDTELVEVMMKRRGFNAAKINSDLSQNERNKVLTSLRDGTLNYLIATDVAARGIDIKELEMVINYSMPKDPETYVHRTGRTGRAGASGKAISIIAPQEFGTIYSFNFRREEPLKEMILNEEVPAV